MLPSERSAGECERRGGFADSVALPRLTKSCKRRPIASAPTSLQVTPRTVVFRYRSAQHWLEVWRTYFGPLRQAFARLDAPGQEALAGDLVALVHRMNRSGDETRSCRTLTLRWSQRGVETEWPAVEGLLSSASGLPCRTTHCSRRLTASATLPLSGARAL
jgi:hypothetical protein